MFSNYLQQVSRFSTVSKFMRHRELIKKIQLKKSVKERTIDNVKLCVLGSGSPSLPAVVMLDANGRRYLFNCGPGIGRISKYENLSLTRVSNVFITQCRWNCIGGIHTLLFDIFKRLDLLIPLPKFHGNRNLCNTFLKISALATNKIGLIDRFLRGNVLKTEQFEDDRIVVDPIRVLGQLESTIIYFCKIKKSSGRIILEKAVEKNLSLDSIWKVSCGEDVSLDDGTVVTRKELSSDEIPEIYFLG